MQEDQNDLKKTIGDVLGCLHEKDIDLFAVASGVLKKRLSPKEFNTIEVRLIHNGNVYVKVASPVVMFTLKFKRQGILKDLKKQTDQIKNIYFKIGA